MADPIPERSIAAERLVAELKMVFAAADGRPKVLRTDNGPEFIPQALRQFCEGPWNGAHIKSFNNRLRKECLTRNHGNTVLEARVVVGGFKSEHNH